jgi:hypothetical protein
MSAVEIVDQPPPVQNERPCIQDLVIADMAERKRLGIQRYGTALQPHNGRDALVDMYQEDLDRVMYARQLIEERADHRAEGAAAEHVSVVAHLNRLAERASIADARAIYMNAASEIERGKHHDTWPAPPPDSDDGLDGNTTTEEP